MNIFKKKKIVVGVVVAVFIFFVLGQTVFKKEKAGYVKEEVMVGTIIQEVSETGTVKKGQDISLSFPGGGKIEKIYVAAGDNVQSGDILAKLDAGQLNIKYIEAQASLEVAKAQLQVAQTLAVNYQNTLLSENQNLVNVSAAAKENLASAYDDAINSLDDAYLKIYNALDTVKTIEQLYFNKGDQESVSVSGVKNTINSSASSLSSAITFAKNTQKEADIEAALSQARKSLENTSSALTTIRQNCDVAYYRDVVSGTYKTYLDNHRAYINAALLAIINGQQTISSAKITNETNIDNAESRVLSAQGNLNKSQNDISLYQAQQKQSEANINLLQKQIVDAAIYAPSSGQIGDVAKKAGETVQASEKVISFMSSGPFQIEADIYEEDVVKVKMGDPAQIKLTAFSGRIFSGKVIWISPAEKLIDGVVYYEIKIDFPEAPEETRVGMTADIVIKTAQKDNVLIVSESAVTKKGDKNFVQVVTGDQRQERDVQIGIKGNEGQVEITYGLQAGEFVAVLQ